MSISIDHGSVTLISFFNKVGIKLNIMPTIQPITHIH